MAASFIPRTNSLSLHTCNDWMELGKGDKVTAIFLPCTHHSLPSFLPTTAPTHPAMVQVEPTSSVPNTLGNPVWSHCPAVGGTVESLDCKVQRTSRTAILVVILAFFLLTRKQYSTQGKCRISRLFYVQYVCICGCLVPVYVRQTSCLRSAAEEPCVGVWPRAGI